MLFHRATAEAIREGRITLAFRRWTQRRVRPGTKLRTMAGVVEVVTVEPVPDDAVSEVDARAAGFASAAALQAELAGRDGTLHRVALRYAGADPRIALRDDDALPPEELDALLARLRRMDAARVAPWTAAMLRLIADQPATLASRLATQLGRETAPFKMDVRRLKELGLTESLEIGYRLSPRGRALLVALERAAGSS
jgi:hypothetical protein